MEYLADILKKYTVVLFYVATFCSFRWHIMTSGKTHWAYYQIQPKLWIISYTTVHSLH